MRKLFLLTGAAALAIAMPAAAEKGGKGQGGGGHAAHVQQSGGGKQAHGGHGGGKGHGGGHAAKPQKAERQAVHAAKPQKIERQAFRGGKPDKAERRAFRDEVKRQERIVRRDFQTDLEPRRELVGFRGDDGTGFGRGCPRGLAKKNNGCLPPGQAKKLFGVGDRLQRDWFSGLAIPATYSGFYGDTPDYYYRYDNDGYIYRVDRNSDLISGIVPLLGGGFAVGQPLPAGYDVYNVPLQYRDVYYDNGDDLYRYGDNAIYRVDQESGLIESIAALLTGDLNVGQPLPTGYDAYNVPMDYRDQYVDNDDYMYRYADGNIYQVDAQTQLIQAIVEMLV